MFSKLKHRLDRKSKRVVALLATAILLCGFAGCVGNEASNAVPNSATSALQITPAEKIPEGTGCVSRDSNITAPTTEIEATAEKIQEDIGFLFFVPEGAEDVTYKIDTADAAAHRGFMGFVLDGDGWNAYVKRSDAFADIVNLYFDDRDGWEKIGCDFDSDQIIKVHGADPDVKCYKIHYADNSEAYMFSAMWFLKDEGFMVALINYSKNPIHSMPVEVFG